MLWPIASAPFFLTFILFAVLYAKLLKNIKQRHHWLCFAML